MNKIELEKIKELLAGPDGRLIQSYVDSRVTAGIKTASENINVVANATKRLKQIEDAADKKIKALELDRTVLKKCYEKKLDYNSISRLGIVFNDENDAEEKLNLLKKDIELKSISDLNESLIKEGFKPSGGNEPSVSLGIYEAWLEKQSPKDRAEIEKMNKRIN